MKKIQFLILALLVLLLMACKQDYRSKAYLKKVLMNMETIKSATYTQTMEPWYPGDTAALDIYRSIVKEYDNPSDNTIGAKFVRLNSSDTSILEFCYDGAMRALVYNDENRIVLDSFNINPNPFRPLTPPFFNYSKSILTYALETNDSISLTVNDSANFVYVHLLIFEDKKVEFFGKAFYMPRNEYDFGETTSSYEIWIDKSNDLPYKIRREMFTQISVTICENIELNTIDIENFNASDYFPDDYSIQSYSLKGAKKKNSELIGKIAPDWTLQTGDKLPFSLSDLKSKVAMIQFTSVSCGPCKASIPFLKELTSMYKEEDFDFVAIECTSRNTNVLKSYMNRNHFDYNFLLASKQVLKDYSIRSFPVFYILDENRKIKNVIYGYGKGATDEKVKTIINEMI